MKCPVDDSVLSVSSREGVEIDFCPQCRGVWLDRGELDKIIDRVASAPPAAAARDDDRRHEAPRADDRYRDDRGRDDRGRDDRGRDDRSRDDRGRDDRGRDDSYDRKRKRRGFLDDLFDF